MMIIIMMTAIIIIMITKTTLHMPYIRYDSFFLSQLPSMLKKTTDGAFTGLQKPVFLFAFRP